MSHPRSTFLLLLLLAPLALVSCDNKPPEPPATPPPTPVPAATPAQAKAAMERAVQLYPDLAKKDSIFNRAFRERYEETKRNRPYLLTNVEWPIELAHRTAEMLGVSPVTVDPATPIVIVRDRPVGALDRGAYGGKKERRQTQNAPPNPAGP